MADLKEKQRVARDSKTALAYQTGFGNHFATEAKAGALPQQSTEAAVGTLCRADFRHRLYGAAARKSPHLDLPHAAVGRASPVRAYRQWAHP